MKILLLKPINQKYYIIQPSLGLGYLARIIKDLGNHVKILDSGKENLTWDKFINYIKEEQFDIIGIQMFAQEFQSVKKHIGLIKEYSPESLILLGGAHISSDPENTMKSLQDANFGFIGESEISIEKFLQLSKLDYTNPEKLRVIPGLVWRQDNKININEKESIQNLDEIKFPEWDLINPSEYPVAPQGIFTKKTPVAPIIVSRGCPYQCTYCSVKTLTGNKMRYRSIGNVIEEILLLYNKYGVREIQILDDNFTSKKEYVLSFCDELMKLNLDIALALPNGVRLDSLDEEVLKKMEKAGFYSMGVGIESGSDRVLKVMKKNLSTKIVKEKIELIKKHTRIHLTGFFIIGYVTETEEEILETIKFAKSLKIDKANFLILMPFPGTEIWEIYKKNNNSEINWENFFFYRVVGGLSDIPSEKLRKLQKKAMMEFYLRPRIILGLINEIKTFSQFKVLLTRTLDVFISSKT